MTSAEWVPASAVRVSKNFTSWLYQICSRCGGQIRPGDVAYYVLKRTTRGGFRRKVMVHDVCP